MERATLGAELSIARLVTGLWQVADIERSHSLDLDAAADELAAYAADGFDTFDMADHYGSAEDIAGRLRARGVAATVLTKWCPTPGPMTREVVRAGIGRSLDRLRTDRIDLLQLHWWSFDHLAYLDAAEELVRLQEEEVIREIGLTNVDTEHLHLLLQHGVRIASNQISFSLLDRRAAGAMSALCLARGVRLLAYGTVAGGLLTERWLDVSAPDKPETWSLMKYRRFVEAAGGWDVFQTVLRAAHAIALRHGVSIANVAARWVLDHPAVAAVIIGARLGEREHRADNQRALSFALSEADRAELEAALRTARHLPGDCGDEYRRPPFLTASGDLSDHLAEVPACFAAERTARGAWRVGSGSPFEAIAGYSRAVRVGDRVMVSGTTATDPHGRPVCLGDPRGQAIYIFDKIAAALRALGASLDDVVRTRIFLRDIGQWEQVARVHGRVFAAVRPANTLVAAALVGDYDVEIEAEAVVAPPGQASAA